MNREIKFRAWDREAKVMEYDILFSGIKNLLQHRLENPKVFEVMQYTGLKDKNGKEIYEGDVLEFWTFSATGNAVKNVSYVKEDGGIYVVPMLYHTNSYYLCDAIWISNKLEKGVFVIGNIYENPELITNL